MSKRFKPEKKAHWHKVISEWKASGEPISRFCRQRNITVSSFYQWRNKLSAAAAPEPRQFIPVQVIANRSEPSSSSHFTLYYPNGCYLRITRGMDLALLQAVNKAMGV